MPTDQALHHALPTPWNWAAVAMLAVAELFTNPTGILYKYIFILIYIGAQPGEDWRPLVPTEVSQPKITEQTILLPNRQCCVMDFSEKISVKLWSVRVDGRR